MPTVTLGFSSKICAPVASACILRSMPCKATIPENDAILLATALNFLTSSNHKPYAAIPVVSPRAATMSALAGLHSASRQACGCGKIDTEQ